VYSKLILGITFGVVLIASLTSVSSASFPGSPNFQLESGVSPEDIVCKPDHVFILRENNSPMCVTLDSAKTLVDRLDWQILQLLSSEEKSENDIHPFERAPPPSLIAEFGVQIDFSEPSFVAQVSDSQWSPFVIMQETPDETELKAVYLKEASSINFQSVRYFLTSDGAEFNENLTLSDFFQNGGIYIIVENRIVNGIDRDFEETVFLNSGYTLKKQNDIDILISPSTHSPLIQIMDNQTYIKLMSVHTSLTELKQLGLSILN